MSAVQTIGALNEEFSVTKETTCDGELLLHANFEDRCEINDESCVGSVIDEGFVINAAASRVESGGEEELAHNDGLMLVSHAEEVHAISAEDVLSFPMHSLPFILLQLDPEKAPLKAQADPCLFFNSGCPHGASCRYSHLCNEGKACVQHEFHRLQPLLHLPEGAALADSAQRAAVLSDFPAKYAYYINQDHADCFPHIVLLERRRSLIIAVSREVPRILNRRQTMTSLAQ